MVGLTLRGYLLPAVQSIRALVLLGLPLRELLTARRAVYSHTCFIRTPFTEILFRLVISLLRVIVLWD